VFSVYGQDPDNDMPLSCYISALPASGTLYQYDGAQFPTTTSATSPTLVTDFNGQLIYAPAINAYGDPLATINMFVNDNSGAANSDSPILVIPFNFTEVALPPSAANITVTMPQNSRLTIQLKVSDPQNYDTVSSIISFPANGALFRSDGVCLSILLSSLFC
jgi:hypothetical protein